MRSSISAWRAGRGGWGAGIYPLPSMVSDRGGRGGVFDVCCRGMGGHRICFQQRIFLSALRTILWMVPKDPAPSFSSTSYASIVHQCPPAHLTTCPATLIVSRVTALDSSGRTWRWRGRGLQACARGSSVPRSASLDLNGSGGGASSGGFTLYLFATVKFKTKTSKPNQFEPRRFVPQVPCPVLESMPF